MSYEADHPAPADLLAVHLGTLDGEDRDPIEEHLSRCPECAQTVLDFNSFPDLEPVDEESPEMRARLEDQKRRLIEMGRREEADSAEVPDSPSRGPRLARSWLSRPGFAWAVAAVFFGATVGLALWGGGPDDVSEVEVIVGSVTQVRSPGEVESISLAGKKTKLLLWLRLGSRNYSEYRVDLRDRAGEMVDSWVIRQLHQGQYLSLQVEHDDLQPGVYRFEAFGIESNQDEPLGSFLVEFTTPPKSQTADK